MRRGACASSWLVALAVIATPAAAADQRSQEAAEATSWAQKLWKEAHDFATRNARKAKDVIEAAEKKRDEAKRAREAVEAEIAAHRARGEKARSETSTTRAAAAEENTEAARVGALAAYLEDKDGKLQAAVDAAVTARLPALLADLVHRKREAAASRIRAARARVEKDALAELSKLAVASATESAPRLSALAEELALGLAEPRLAKAARRIGRAHAAIAKGQRGRGALTAARRALEAALPTEATIRRALESALGRLVGAATSLAAGPRLARALAAGATSDAPPVERFTGRVAALLATSAFGDESTFASTTPDLTTAAAQLAAAVRSASERLRARWDAWRGGLRALESVAKEMAR